MTNAETRILLIQIASDNDEVYAFCLTYRLLLFCRLYRCLFALFPWHELRPKKYQLSSRF